MGVWVVRREAAGHAAPRKCVVVRASDTGTSSFENPRKCHGSVTLPCGSGRTSS